MVTLHLNRDRRDLARAIDNRDVYRHSSGYPMRKRRANLDQRVDRHIRDFTEAGWVQLGADGIYTLTATFRAAATAAGNVTPSPPLPASERT